MAAAEDDTSRLFRVRKTLMQMLRDRGYNVEEEEINMKKQQFADRFGDNVRREDLTIVKHNRDDPNDKIFLFFPNDESVGVATLRPYIDRMTQDGVLRAIVVVQRSITPSAKKRIQELLSTKYLFEAFQEAELLVNITEHELVPKHQLLTNTEKKELLDRYTLKETQLPRILLTDPVARYYGLRRGQVVKVTRQSETAGEYITYRIVI